jgi:hypothetical protein
VPDAGVDVPVWHIRRKGEREIQEIINRRREEREDP